MSEARRAVFLDRDGVLNRAIVVDGKPYPPKSADTLEIVPTAPEVLESLKRQGFLLIVVTNQPDVARGKQTRQEVQRIQDLLAASLPLDDFLVCYHEDRDECCCRKPKPGLLLEAATKHGIELKDSYLIGDRWRDVDAGRAAGCSTVWIDCGYSERAPADPSATVSSLKEAGEWILGRASASLRR